MSIQEQIEHKLTDALQPSHLDVINESHMHNVPEGSESHFKVVVVSEAFAGLTRVKRHQKVYTILCRELDGLIHALSVHTWAPDEWSGVTPDSPPCLGGSRSS